MSPSLAKRPIRSRLTPAGSGPGALPETDLPKATARQAPNGLYAHRERVLRRDACKEPFYVQCEPLQPARP
jgi:hypothetical protein